MIVPTDMNAVACNDVIEELNSEWRLALMKGDLDRADVLAGAINRVFAELSRERLRPTADPSTRAA